MKLTPTRFLVYGMVGIAAILSGSAINAKSNLTPAQKAEIVTRFATEAKYNFAHYDRVGKEFDSICRARLPEIVNTPTDEDFNRELILLVNTLKDGHTSVSWTDNEIATAPFLQKRFGDRVFITEVFSDNYTSQGVTRGTELLAIDGIPVIEYGETQVVPLIPSSTPQWSASYPYGSINLTKGKRGVPITFTFKNKKGKSFQITDQRLSPWNTVNPSTQYTFSKLKDNIGLLRFPSFRADGFDVDKFVELFKTDIVPLRGLIIDIRDNSGGNSGLGDFVMQMIGTDTIPRGTWSTPKYRAAYASWGAPAETDTIPMPDLVPFSHMTDELPEFNVPVVLLINSGTFSASEDFAVLFRNAKRGPIIGTPTGGSTGNSVWVDLGYGYWGRICTINETFADGTQFIGVGIQPDIYVEETPEVLTGKDPVIDAALDYFKTHKQ